MKTTTIPGGLIVVLAALVAGCGGSGKGNSASGASQAAPAGLTYHDSSVVYARGAGIVPDTPSSSGGQAVRYAVQPPLPAGLGLDPQTGVISGTPAGNAPATVYRVTASNPEGSATARVEIEVKDVVIAPDELSYLDSSVIYVVGEEITPNAPLCDGGEIVQYTVSPALPLGLSIDSQTGTITGTPFAESAPLHYTITGSNAAGTAETQIDIEVRAQVTAPGVLDYADASPVYTVGLPVAYDEPEYSGGEITQFAVVPALPAGLSLNTRTGSISGTPSASQAQTTYTVTGTNSAGSTTALIAITVINEVVGEWLPADALNGKGRNRHTATVLVNGMVLVAGGFGPGGALKSTELYDPAANLWSPAGSLGQERQSATATLLRDGRVLIVGGFSRGAGNSAATAELFDPATATWSPTGGMAQARDTHTATLLSDGRVLVAGGEDPTGAALASAEIYDPATGTWSPTGGMGQARAFHTASLLPDDRILVAGGVGSGDARSARLASSEIYDPAAQTWSSVASMRQGRSLHGTASLRDGRVLVAGGDDGKSALASTELFDPATGMWTQAGALAHARRLHTVGLLADGRIVVVGGSDRHALTSTELFDAAALGWSPSGNLAHARHSHTTTLLTDGRLLVAGGDGKGHLSSAELFH